MIYFHLVYYSDTYHSKHSSTHDHPNRGKIAVYSKKIGPDDIDSELKYKLSKIDYEDKKLFGPNSINLLVPKLIGSSENTFIGWFSDHQQWDEKFQCFNNRWTLCDKILFAQCQQNRIRSIFQFIPFKPNANIRHLYFSLRATAEQLVEQSNDAFYGLMALVQLVDGREHIVKLKFQYESEAWSLKSQDYYSDTKPIYSVTIMVACFGYSGIASFTDIRLSSNHAGLDPIFSSQDICSWCDYQSINHSLKTVGQMSEHLSKFNSIQPEIVSLKSLKQSSNDYSSSLVTYVSQVSMDRLTALERSLQTWTGPISIAIHISVKSSTEGILDWQRRYIFKKIGALNISTTESTIIFVPTLENDNYPINLLRNLAIKMCKTRYMLLVDVDFQPSPLLEMNFASFINNQHSDEKLKIAFVVPAFEYVETPNKYDPILKSKDELIQLVHREDPLLLPYRFTDSPESHSLTNYWKWYYTNEPYKVAANFNDKYEPFIIIEKTKDLPLFNEELINFGMDKVMYITELFSAKYASLVVFDIFFLIINFHFLIYSVIYFTYLTMFGLFTFRIVQPHIIKNISKIWNNGYEMVLNDFKHQDRLFKNIKSN